MGATTGTISSLAVVWQRMALVAELRLHGDSGVLVRSFEAVPRAECTFDDVHYVDDDRGRTYYVLFLWLTGVGPDAFTAALEADPTIREYRRLASVDDRRLFRVVTTPFPSDQPLVYPQCRKHDVTVVEARCDAAGLHLHARFPSRSEFDDFLDRAEEMAHQVEVTRLYTDGDDPVADDLTRKQREALALAYERGYFATPSEVTLDALAADLDITPQTLSRHLRVGVRKVVGEAVARRRRSPAPELKDTSE